MNAADSASPRTLVHIRAIDSRADTGALGNSLARMKAATLGRQRVERSAMRMGTEAHELLVEEYQLAAEEPEAIARQLRNLHMQLETGAVSEEDFEKRKTQLLDRLDQIEARGELTDDEEADRAEEAATGGEALSGDEESEEATPHAG